MKLNCPAFDLAAACAGFMYALITGAQFVAAGTSLSAASVSTADASLGGNVTTTGAQQYTGTITLSNSVTLASSGSTINTVNVSGGGNSFTANAAGNITTNNVAADNLTFSSGGLVSTNTLNVGGNYSVTAQDFSGSLAPVFGSAKRRATTTAAPQALRRSPRPKPAIHPTPTPPARVHSTMLAPPLPSPPLPRHHVPLRDLACVPA